MGGKRPAPPEPEGSSGTKGFVHRRRSGGQIVSQVLSLFVDGCPADRRAIRSIRAPAGGRGWSTDAESDTMTCMNEESLQRANAFLAAVAARATPGELVDLSPAELGKEIRVVEPRAAARAVRALLPRGRLGAVARRDRVLGVFPT